MSSDAERIAERIWNSEDPVIELSRKIEIILEEQSPQMNRFARSAFAEELHPKIQAVLRRRIDRDVSRKVTPRFEFGQRSDNRLVRVGFGTGDRLARLVVETRDELVDKMQAMHWRAFELLCVFMLSSYDAQDVSVTRRSKEGGIDFYAWLPVSTIATEKEYLWEHLTMRLVGQAKRSSADESMMDEFIKKMRDFSDKLGRGWKLVDERFARSGAALLRMFLITGKFTRGARDSAVREGVLALDGEQVAELLLKSRGAHQWITPRSDEQLWFDATNFIRGFEEAASSS